MFASIAKWWNSINWGNTASTTLHTAAVAGVVAQTLSSQGVIPNTGPYVGIATGVIATGLIAKKFLSDPTSYPQTPLTVTSAADMLKTAAGVAAAATPASKVTSELATASALANAVSDLDQTASHTVTYADGSSATSPSLPPAVSPYGAPAASVTSTVTSKSAVAPLTLASQLLGRPQ